MPGIENLAPERTETRSGFFGSPKPLPVRSSTCLHRVQDVVPQAGRQLLAGGEVVVAGLGGDREARRGRQAGERHLGEAGALAAEEVLHLAVAFGRAVAPGVDVALGGRVGTRGRCDVGHGAGSPLCAWAAGRGAVPRWVRLRPGRLYRPAASRRGPVGPLSGAGAPAARSRTARGGRRRARRRPRPERDGHARRGCTPRAHSSRPRGISRRARRSRSAMTHHVEDTRVIAEDAPQYNATLVRRVDHTRRPRVGSGCGSTASRSRSSPAST